MKVVELLLKAGADIEAKDIYRETPVSWAAEKRHIEVVELLLKAGADIEAKDNNGQTPVSWAARKRLSG